MSTTLPKLNVYCYQYFCKQVAIICHSLPTFPARGTWIEITSTTELALATNDVPRKGNVDRNDDSSISAKENAADVPRKGNVDRNPLPVRLVQFAEADVPRKGNVDRNITVLNAHRANIRRSPQGERG